MSGYATYTESSLDHQCERCHRRMASQGLGICFRCETLVKRGKRAAQQPAPRHRQRQSVLPVRGQCRHWTRDQGCPLHGETCAPHWA